MCAKGLPQQAAWVATQPACAAGLGPHAATAVLEAARGATRLGLPSRAAPPASSPRAVLMENASQAALHVKIDSIERAGLHL